MDCLVNARVSKVICKYFLIGFPDVIFKMPFGSLGSYDHWRNDKVNSNKIVVSTHILYDYPNEIFSRIPQKDSRAENRSLFE